MIYNKQPAFSSYISSTTTADYWWVYDYARQIGPHLCVVEGEHPRDTVHHQLPDGFKPPGEGVDFGKCVKLHEERKQFWTRVRSEKTDGQR